MKTFFFDAMVFMFLCSGIVRGIEMESPDSRVKADFYADKTGQLFYRISFRGRDVIETSPLGIKVDGVNLGKHSAVAEPVVFRQDSEYAVRGNHTRARNRYNLWSYPLKHTSGRESRVEFRLYDDGVAYRYIVPGSGDQHVEGESSSWKVVSGSQVWYFERLAPAWKLKTYAGEWISVPVEKLEKATPARIGPVQGTPLVFDLPGELGYAVITKAACYNYSGMRLRAVGERRIVADFTEGKKGFDVKGDVVTPWCAVLLAEDLNELVNSDFVTNLNPPPDAELFADTSYIRSGRCVWSWETIGLGSPEDQRSFIDMASDMGFEYSLIDDGWKDWKDPFETIESICDYAASKGVRVFVWVHSKDICNSADNYRQMREYFDRVAATGACGLKIDFMNGESKELIDFEIAALRLAAQRKLLINFHGCHAPTGEERTYPNEITREGIRGIELNKMKEGPLPASHNAALPFTRYVVGHGDYTPVLYTNPGATTWAHQLATAVLFNSPLQVYAEHPELMMTHPVLKQALPVVKALPSVWDETIVLPGSRIGELVAFARRSDNKWFVAVLNGGKAREFIFNTDVLGKGEYHVTIVCDDAAADRVDLAGMNPRTKLKDNCKTAVPFKVVYKKIKSPEIQKISLSDGGGAVIMFTSE
ncbi:MAG: glycoside hydrolase family 97 catalytic domain-containing protein [Kiritimatiellia bacterium]